MTDIEEELRSALKSSVEHLTQNDLYRTSLGASGKSKSVRPLLIGSSVAIVLLVAAGILVSTVRGGPSRNVAGNTDSPLPPTTLIGSTWQVTQVEDSRGTTAIPSSVTAYIEFESSGQFAAKDGLNWITGRYQLDGASLRFSDASQTLIGYRGPDTALLRVMRAFESLQRPDAIVTVSVTSSSAVLIIESYRITCVRSPAPNPSSPQPVPSSS